MKKAKGIKNVAVLGSTGSIGINTLKVIEHLPGRFRVVGLSAFSNISLLQEQIRRFKPSVAAVVDPKGAGRLKKKINTRRTRLFSAAEGLSIMASLKEVDIVVVAIAGASAIYPLSAAIKARKHICLANKEAVVMAGGILMKDARRRKSPLIPVDSEHSAIFQCIGTGGASSRPKRIYLTGSGGPLRRIARSRFSSLKVSDVLRHPKWKMGKKITVDSATLMNKGLEMIEAKHLFDLPLENIELLIHPEAIIHSMVEFADGAIIAQLGVTDMRLPIQYALTYPERVPGPVLGVDFSKVASLNFCRPEPEKYPCLSLAAAAAKLGGTYPAVLNAANEEAVRSFLKGGINIVMIPDIIERLLLKHRCIENPQLSDIIQADAWAREEARSLC